MGNSGARPGRYYCCVVLVRFSVFKGTGEIGLGISFGLVVAVESLRDFGLSWVGSCAVRFFSFFSGGGDLVTVTDGRRLCGCEEVSLEEIQ